MFGNCGHDPMTETSRTAAILLMLVAAILWGLWWAPIRFLEGMGLRGVWAGVGMNLGALPLLALLAAMAPARARLGGRALLGAVLIGLGVTLYASSLALTDVLRAILLFYLAPAWGIAIECLFLGRRWSWQSLLALTLSFAGIITIFRADFSLAAWGIGDLFALFSGAAWAIGTALIFTAPQPSGRVLAFTACSAALITGILIALASGASPEIDANVASLARIGAYVLAIGILFHAPIMLITTWGALKLPPATLSFTFTAEIIAGVASSAIFLAEPFGAPELVGAVLVMLGATIELVSSSAAGDQTIRAG